MAVSVARAGAVRPTPSAAVRLRPAALGDVAITGGFWAERLRRNRERTIPHGFAQLDRAGNFHDLRLAAGASGSYQALGLMFGAPFPFLDSDVYKWLEAAGWELGRAESDELRSQAAPRSRWPSSSSTGRRASGATSRPRPRSSTGGATDFSARIGSERPTGRTTRPSATRRPSPVTPSASSTSTAARSTSRRSS